MSPLGRMQTRTIAPTFFLQSQNNDSEPEASLRQRLRRRVTKLAKNIVTKPIQLAAPDAVLAVLTDATAQAVDTAVDNLVKRRAGGITAARRTEFENTVKDTTALIDDAFKPIEDSLQEMEDALKMARESLEKAKLQARDTLETSMATSMAQALEGAVEAVEKAEQEASRKVLADIYASTVDDTIDSSLDISELAFEDVDYGTSEMAPPFLGEDQCACRPSRKGT